MWDSSHQLDLGRCSDNLFVSGGFIQVTLNYRVGRLSPFCHSSVWHCRQSGGWLPLPGRVGELLLPAASPASHGMLGSEGMIWVIHSKRCAEPQWGYTGFLTERELRLQRDGTRAALWFSPCFFQAVLSPFCILHFPSLPLSANVSWFQLG